MDRLSHSFFTQDALALAPQLLGTLLCREVDGNVLKLRITETESYCGEADTACHAHKGRTARTQIMYGPGGRAYIYLCYGIHYLLNVVAGPEEQPEAVLIRGVSGFSGPGRLTKALHIDKSLNGENLIESARLWIETDGATLPFQVTPRIGIAYATPEYRDKPWRFVAKNP